MRKVGGGRARAVRALSISVLLLLSIAGAVAAGPSASPSTTLAHPSPLASASVTSSIGNPDVNDVIWLNATTTGGTVDGWTWLPPGCASSTSKEITCRITGGGDTVVRPTIWLSAGLLGNSSGGSGSTTVSIAPPVSATISQSSGVVELGAAVTYTVAGAGGTGVYRETYKGLPVPCLSVNSTKLICTPDATGTSDVLAAVKDSLRPPGNPEPGTNNATTNSLDTEVVPDPTLALSAEPSLTDAGVPVQFNATTDGGVGPHTFWWGFGDGGSSMLRNPSHSYPKAGTFDVHAWFNDSQVEVESSVSITIDPAVTVTVSPSLSPIDAGQTTTLTAIAGGGSSSYPTFAFYSGSSCTGAPLQTGSSNTYATPSLSSTTTFCGEVTDSVGGTATSTATVTVNPTLAVLLAASPSAVDPGQTTVLTATASGGSSSYASYSFSSGTSCSGTPLQTGASTTYTSPPLSSSATFCVAVLDSLGSTATNTVTVGVNPALTVTVSASPPTVAPGQSTTLTASATGGSGAYSMYSFYSGSSCTGSPLQAGASNAYATSALSSTATFCAEVMDSLGSTATNAATVTVSVDLLVTLTSSPTTVDPGQTSVLSAATSGGSGVYTNYAFYSGNGCTGSPLQTGTSATYTTMSLGSTASFCVEVTDSSSDTATGSVTVSVNPTLSIALVPSPSTIDPGQSATFSASPAGGSSSYTDFAFYAGGSCQGTPLQAGPQSSFATPPLTSTTTYCAEVTDSVGGMATQSATVTVNPALTASLVAAPPSVDPGQTSTVTAMVGGGSGSYPSFAFYAGGTCTGAPLQSGASASYSTLSLSSNATLCVEVTDSLGGTVTTTTTVVVNPPLSAVSRADLTTVDSGVPDQFLGTGVGGSGSYSYAWTFGTGGATSHAPSPTFSYPTTGSFEATFWVNDSQGESARSTLSIMVVAPVLLDATLAPLSGPSPLTISGSASTSGGLFPVNVSWTWGDASSSAGPLVSHLYATPGTYRVNVFANDTAGGHVAREFNVTVGVPLSLQGVTADPNGSHPGTSVQITANTLGGESPLSFAWTENGTALATDAGSFSFVPKGAGNFTFAVEVSDGWGEQVDGEVILEVVANSSSTTPPSTLSASLVTGPASATVGATLWLNATASGGTAPYAYTFFENASGSSSFQRLTACAATASQCTLVPVHGGEYSFYVSVQDQLSNIATSGKATVAVSWVSGSTPPSGGHGSQGTVGPFTTSQVEAIAVVSVVLLAVLLLLLVLGRRRRRSEPVPSPAEGEETWPVSIGSPSGENLAGEVGVVPALLTGATGATSSNVTATGTDAVPPSGARSVDGIDDYTEEGLPPGETLYWSEEPEGSESPANVPDPASETPAVELAPASSAPSSKPATKGTVLRVRSSAQKEWTRSPLTFAETRDPQQFWKLALGAGVPPASLLLLVDEQPKALRQEYSLDGVEARWICRTEEEEDAILPGDLDRIGFLIDDHFREGEKRAVVITGIERLVTENGAGPVVRLLDHVRDAARSGGGAVLVHINPVLVDAQLRLQIEERANVIRLLSGKRSGPTSDA